MSNWNCKTTDNLKQKKILKRQLKRTERVYNNFPKKNSYNWCCGAKVVRE